MGLTVGIQSRYYFSDDGSSYDEILNASDNNPGGQENDEADATHYGQGDAQKRRIKTLHDNKLTLKIDFDPTDTVHAALRDATDAGTDVWIKVLLDGTVGWSMKYFPKSYSWGDPIGGKVDCTFNLEANGPKTNIP